LAGGRNRSRARLTAAVRVARNAGRSNAAWADRVELVLEEAMRGCFRGTGLGAQVYMTRFRLRLGPDPLFCPAAIADTVEKALNAELTKKALEKVGNPNILVNLISRRVRQLNAGSGAMSRPLVAETSNLGAADIALLEIIEEKIGFEMPELVELARPVGKKRKRH
jgi:DNA-directed RNA polymerase subunit omega